MLTEKLTSVGQTKDVKKEKEQKNNDVNKKEPDILPTNIKECVSRARKIPSALMKEQDADKRYILISYNKWLKMIFYQKENYRQEELRKILERCSTYKALEMTMRKYDVN